jgi:hypothetical protein
MEAHKS